MTTAWILASYNETSEIDISSHPIEEAAQCALVDELHELFGDDFADYPPPEGYVPKEISSWLSENLITFKWSIKQVKGES